METLNLPAHVTSGQALFLVRQPHRRVEHSSRSPHCQKVLGSVPGLIVGAFFVKIANIADIAIANLFIYFTLASCTNNVEGLENVNKSRGLRHSLGTGGSSV